jgi:site-specific DNA-methyltransferase (adenine-specific)
MRNTLYYGDNLDILRHYIPDESIDLIYLDPPFNSKATYNVLFAEKNGSVSAAQIKAFEDTWSWDKKAEEIYCELIEHGPKKVADLIQALRSFLGSNDMMAYLTMMAIRLVELYRILKPSGSIYLHCDPTASHYLKMVMDAVYGVKKFQNEIIWSYRTGGVSLRRWGRKHDVILFYSKENSFVFNAMKEKSYLDDTFFKPWQKKSKELGIQQDEKGMFRWVSARDVWNISVPHPHSDERLGYPTQKPEALLERIINVSSNENDIVLDPFCGCGTTITVAEKLNRKWIGIDITHLAISLMKNRLQDTFGDSLDYDVVGEPVDLKGAMALKKQDPYQFQWWALGLVGARPAESEKKKGADKGIDGYIYFHDDPKLTTKKIILQVKSGHVGSHHVVELKGVLEREKAQIGVFITLENPTKPMITEAVSSGYYRSPIGHDYPKMQILTIAELLDGAKIEYPSRAVGADATFKKAERYKAKREQEKLF